LELTQSPQTTRLNDSRREIIEIRSNKGIFDLELGMVVRYWELLFALVWRDLQVRYRQAFVGAGWAIVQPIFVMVVFTLVFGRFAKIPSDGIPYPVFSFVGLLPWMYFSESLGRGSTGLVAHGDLIRKVYFPRLIIPIASAIVPVVDFCLSFVVLLSMLAWYGIMPTWHVVFLPLFLLIAMMLSLAVGLWLGPTNVRFRDIQHTVPLLIQVWMYCSPIIYPVSMVPERWKLLYSLNPMVGVIEGFRWALLDKANPDFRVMAVSLSCVLLILIGGLLYFKRMEKTFGDVI
jgi:lipopolysaccharide transport system permease protein